MRKVGRGLAAAAATGFACVCYVYLTLPDVRPLRTTNPTTTAFIELRLEEARARGAPPRKVQRWTNYGRISPHLKRAVLAAEDGAFWQHEGIDVEQIKESVELNLERLEFARGASTITQQLAKNLYLSPTRSPVRKVRELFIARRLEHELGKQRILELYLNLIEWGDGVYGAEAAAREHFGKSAAALTASESALLAGAIINPRVLSPSKPTARLLRRQRLLMGRMGAVTPPERIPAREPPAEQGASAAAEPTPGRLPDPPVEPAGLTVPGAEVPAEAAPPLPAPPDGPAPTDRARPDAVHLDTR